MRVRHDTGWGSAALQQPLMLLALLCFAPSRGKQLAKALSSSAELVKQTSRRADKSQAPAQDVPLFLLLQPSREQQSSSCGGASPEQPSPGWPVRGRPVHPPTSLGRLPRRAQRCWLQGCLQREGAARGMRRAWGLANLSGPRASDSPCRGGSSLPHSDCHAGKGEASEPVVSVHTR